MSKERLEEINKSFNFWMKEDESIGLLPEDIQWLIEQAERVQELEKDIKEWEIVNESWEEINTQIAEQNKRYRELLKKIKEMTRYDDCREAEIYELVSDEFLVPTGYVIKNYLDELNLNQKELAKRMGMS